MNFTDGMWQFDESEINSIGMIQPSHSRHSGLSALSGMSQITGINTLSSCGTPDHLDGLPELPAAEEKRLRRAALMLQQRLVLRQWLIMHRLHQAYSKLISLDVTSIEDVYWLEDSTARHVIDPKDFGAWSAARQSLPTTKEALTSLKEELWSSVVKNTKHQDAWAWGSMLVVSVSVCGLVTLAAMTQPSLAPEAKHSLLQYVTGKYLYPPNCKVEWGWTEPVRVGQTMCFTLHCYQRNGQPYPVCDTDDLTVYISHGTRKIATVVDLGSDDPAEAHTARVKFTVRVAGVYIMSVLIAGVGVPGSPFRRTFLAGPVCADTTRLERAAAALPCVLRQPRALRLLPRDAHDNPALPALRAGAPEGFSLTVRPLGAEPDASLSESASISYCAVNQRVSVSLTFPDTGVYEVSLYYENTLLKNGSIHCIVLTASDMASVQRSVSRRRGACYMARLLAPDAASAGKSRRVLCFLGPRQLTVHQYVLKLIPKRVAAFRLAPSTKLILKPAADPSGAGAPGGDFTVDDGVQPALDLTSPQRDLIAAAFTQLLQANCGGEDSFKNKQEFFYSELRKLHARHPHTRLSVRVSRADLLRTSVRATSSLGRAAWCRAFHVSFQGEQGVDWGGVRREWFSLLCETLFSAEGGLFVAPGGDPAGLVAPNPQRPPHLKLKHYELAGKLVGKCLYESALGGSYRQLVRARLARSFLAQIIGLRVHYKYFEQDDPELYMSKIKYVLETDLDAPGAAELYFSEDIYCQGRLRETRALLPGGDSVRVTNANKSEYLDLLTQWRLVTRARAETGAFLRGLSVLVPPHLLAIFDENELELLVCGTGEVSVSDWRAHALVSGAGREWARLVSWFWAAVEGLTPAERARLLQFTTGTAQLPPRGFQDLNPRFQITPAANFGALPTAHTCFNQLCLPDYDCYEQLVHALLWAINEGGEGFAMI